MIDEMYIAVYKARSENRHPMGWRMSPSAFDDLRLASEINSNFVRCDSDHKEAMGMPIEITFEIDGWELLLEPEERTR